MCFPVNFAKFLRKPFFVEYFQENDSGNHPTTLDKHKLNLALCNINNV